jgi:hypothetical protein
MVDFGDCSEDLLVLRERCTQGGVQYLGVGGSRHDSRVHIDFGTFHVLLAEVDNDFEGVVADVENVRVSPFGLPLTHARLAVGAPRVSHQAPRGPLHDECPITPSDVGR